MLRLEVSKTYIYSLPFLPVVSRERRMGVANELIRDDRYEEGEVCACEVHQIEVRRCAHAPYSREHKQEGGVADTAETQYKRHDHRHRKRTNVIILESVDIGRVQECKTIF